MNRFSIKKELSALIVDAKKLGLAEADVVTATEFLAKFEYGLCFDTVLTQLYEYNIPINTGFYTAVENMAKVLGLPKSEFKYMAALIK